jgi:AraC-like DNA-binding protein
MDSQGFPISYAAILTDIAVEHGAERGKLLAAAGIAVEDLSCADAHFSSQQLKTLVQEAKQQTAEPALCLYFGEQLTLTSHGVLGYALMSCRNIQQAVDLLIKYHRLLLNDISLSVRRDNDHIIIEYQPRESALIGQSDDCELFFACVISSVKHMLHRQDFSCEIRLDYPAPAHAERYEALLGPYIHFSQSHCQVSFAADWLELQPVFANPVMLTLYEQQCEQLLQRMEQGAGLEEKVRQYLIASQNFSSLQQTAEHFHMSPRTFRRRLTQESTAFQDILDKVRRQLAETYLSDRSITIEHTAELLGFHDVSNFRRAFIRWTGMSPAAFKRQ